MKLCAVVVWSSKRNANDDVTGALLRGGDLCKPHSPIYSIDSLYNLDLVNC